MVSRVAVCLRLRWEAIFFVAVWVCLTSQIYFLQADLALIGRMNSFLRGYTSLNAFIFHIYGPFFAVASFALIGFSLFKTPNAVFSRRLFDLLGAYYCFRVVIQLIGLNALVFDSESSSVLLITQLLFFLPYMLLIWGWVYWRLDAFVVDRRRPWFRLDHEAEFPRAIDYYIASFSTVFSASISNIKGASARSRVLILLHGLMIYNVMGLLLSRTVSLVHRSAG